MATLLGRNAVVRAADGHPLARLRAVGADIRGYQAANALVWTVQRASGRGASALGDGLACAALLGELHSADLLGAARWVELPRISATELADHVAVSEIQHASLLWARRPPSAEVRYPVTALDSDDHDAIAAVLDEALPYTRNRPGNADIRGWYGIRLAGRLVAVAGDRREAGMGYLAGVAVAPDHQGRGVGTALTCQLTRRLIAEFGICALMVVDHNAAGRDFFARLGYSGRLDLTVATLA